MKIQVIKTEEQYHSYLSEVERLMFEPRSLTREESEALELLSLVIESYENDKYPIDPPNPIDAILFRMEEKGLRKTDLVPYFGTSSRVSEVLGRKRQLTVQMIRALSVGLGIPADILVGLSEERSSVKKGVDWSKFPIKEMVKRGWLQEKIDSGFASTEDVVRDYLVRSGVPVESTSFRRTLSGSAMSPTSEYAVFAWVARVTQRSRETRGALPKFDPTVLSSSFLRELAQMSWLTRGPEAACAALMSAGISVVVEPQLKGTQLDGAALKDVDGTPIIALTLRFDRMDSFWFTLMHEVVHIWKHVPDAVETFVDDVNSEIDDRREAEANRLARDALIPRSIWRRSDAYVNPSKDSVLALAKELKIHPAIIVGRLHREFGNYAILNDLLGRGEVRRMIADNEDEWI